LRADELLFAVTDTGIGISAEHLPRLFQKFSQADSSTTRRFGGTGLGLTVCKRLVNAMNGDILVASQPGKGSTFTVELELPVEQTAPKKPSLAGLAVALALPSPLASRCILDALRDAGCEPRLIGSPAGGRAGEIVLTQSDLLAAHGGGRAALNVCLTDVGDNRADALIRNRAAVDLLPLPLGRSALWEFLARAARFDFRGPAALAASVVMQPQASFGHLSILAVDDNAVNREVLREALLGLGVEADFVTNGAEAVEAAKRKSYDVIFMDGSMPEMDGFTATRLIRRRETEANTRRAQIIALTAQVRGADAEAWAAAGADRHMTKPFTSARLTEALRATESGAFVPAAPVAAAAASEPDLIDEEAVASMAAVGSRSGRDVVGKVWKLFLGQAPEALAKLEALLAGNAEPPALARQAHLLKSMSLSAGAARLAALCETIEREGRSGDPGAARSLVSSLRPVVDATCGRMNNRLAARPVAAAAV
jgi:CheY-like chemotaxis protein/HPt (histidine-containing phosphotransfer) domain-containing protein